MISFWWLMFIGVILFVVALALVIEDEDEGKFTTQEAICAIASLVCFILPVFGVCSTNFVYEDKPYSIEHLVALQDNNLMNGHAYAHRTYINEEMWYQYMVKLKDGSMTMNRIKAEGTKVYYSDEPMVKWYHGKQKLWIFYWNTPSKQELYIPEGTVQEEYNIDLQ